MKRTALLIAILVITLLASISLVMAQAGVPSVANLVDFQGKLTTPAGNPVANGPHSFVFRIYDLPAGGVLQWSEGPLAISTTGGLFTHQLGSSTSLPVTLFEDFDSLYLEVEADGAIITPRTRLISSPYTKVAGGLDGRSPYGPGDSTYIKTFPLDHRLSTFGVDGREQIRLWGPSWGEIYLFDEDPTNNLTAVLSSNNFLGGYLRLGNDAGGTTIELRGGGSGDATAILPTDAINAGEMLNEPGVSNNQNPTFFTSLTSNSQFTIDTVDITIPTAGYVVVTAGCYVNSNHVTGTGTQYELSIDNVAASADFGDPGGQIYIIPSGYPSGNTQTGITTTRMFVEGTAGLKRYFFSVSRASAGGTPNIANPYIRAVFYPTLYGSVTLANSSVGLNVPADGSQAVTRTDLTTITLEEHNARLKAERDKLTVELEARLKKLEEAAKQGKQVVDDNR